MRNSLRQRIFAETFSRFYKMRSMLPLTKETTNRGLQQLLETCVLGTLISYVISTSLMLACAYGAITAWLLLKLLDRKPIIPNLAINRYFEIVFITLLLSVLFGSDFAQSGRGLHKWLRGVLMFWVAYEFFQDKKHESKALVVIVTAFLIATIDGIIQHQTGKDIIRGHPLGSVDQHSRVTSLFGYFGMFAFFLLANLPLVLAFASRARNWLARHFLTILFLMLGLTNLFWTRTRGAWLVFIAISFLLAFRIKRRWILATFILALTVVPFLFPKSLLFHHPKPQGFDKSVNLRLQLWREAANIIKARPLTGSGLNTYVRNIERYNAVREADVSNYYAHNGYLQHAAETGYLGLAALILLILYYLRRSFGAFLKNGEGGNVFALHAMLTLSNVGFLFYMLFDTIFHNLQPFLLFWVLLGWSLSQLDKQELKSA